MYVSDFGKVKVEMNVEDTSEVVRWGGKKDSHDNGTHGSRKDFK